MALNQIKPALQYSEGRYKPWSGAALVNCFSEKADGDKRADFAVMAIPGLTLFKDLATAPVRGLHVMANILYAVVGQRLWSVTQDGTATDIGEISGTAPVRMADNGTQLAICAAPVAYVLSDGAIVMPADLAPVSDVDYIDSYILWTLAESDQVAYSAIGDATLYDGLDIFSAEGSPDGLVGMIVAHREVLLFGSETIEIFYNSGGADNAFERQGNAFIERGCFDRDSIVKIDNSVHFVGDDRIVYRLDGYSPIRISTHAIEYGIRDCAWTRGFTYTQEGHKFYVLNTDKGCFVYDMATGAWHTRRSWNLDNYRVSCATVAWGQTVMGDGYTGRIYQPDLDQYSENGEIISVEIALPTLGDGSRRLTCYAFQAIFDMGAGLNTGQGSDPQVMLRYSKDGGRIKSNELWRSLGKIGEYLTRAIWRNLGQFYQLQIELTITDPVRRLAISYLADIR